MWFQNRRAKVDRLLEDLFLLFSKDMESNFLRATRESKFLRHLADIHFSELETKQSFLTIFQFQTLRHSCHFNLLLLYLTFSRFSGEKPNVWKMKKSMMNPTRNLRYLNFFLWELWSNLGLINSLYLIFTNWPSVISMVASSLRVFPCCF